MIKQWTYSMSKLTPEQVNKYLNNILSFVETLPLKDKGKEYIKFNLLDDFYDVWHFDDEENDFTREEYFADRDNPRYRGVKATYGIQNTTQLKRYMKNFKAFLSKSRMLALKSYLEDLDKLHPSEKAMKLLENLSAITRKEMFARHGLEKIKEPEWNINLKEILGNELLFAKDQAELIKNNTPLPKAEKPNQNIMNDEKFIVEELEDRLAIEAVDYRHKCDELWEQYQFDPTYFDIFISGPLLNEFTTSLYDRIRPLNDQEINRYLTISLQQFTTHTPEKRLNAFLLNYHNTYWYPNHMPYKGEEYADKYAAHVWKHYANHFGSFQTVVENIYQDFKTGLTAKAGNPTPNHNSTQIKYDDYYDFTANLFYRDPLEKPPLSYISKWADDFKYLRKEILENLINLSPEKKKPYLEFLLVDLEHFLSSKPEKEQLMHEYYHKFNTSEEEVLKTLNFDNPLFVALMFSHDSLSNRPDFELKNDIRNIQNTFYFIHLNRTVKEAIDFIEDQLARIDPQAGIKPIKNTPPTNTIKEYTFENFVTPDKQTFILALLDDLSITRDGVSILSVRKKSALRGIIEALRENNIVPPLGFDTLVRIVAIKIGLQVASKLDWSHTSDEYKSRAEKYIKAHYRS